MPYSNEDFSRDTDQNKDGNNSDSRNSGNGRFRSRNYKRNQRNKRRRINYGKQINLPTGLNMDVGKQSSHAFGLIDKRYSLKTELLPGLVTYNRPLVGKVDITINLNINILTNILKSSLARWTETIGYHELRSGKSIIGSVASEPITAQLDKTVKFVIKHIVNIIVKISAMESFPLALEQLGMNTITIPTLVYDIMHIVISGNRIQRLEMSDQSMVKFSTQCSSDLVKYYSDMKMQDLQISTSFYELSLLSSQMKLGESKTVSTINEFNLPSDHLMNALLIGEIQEEAETELNEALKGTLLLEMLKRTRTVTAKVKSDNGYSLMCGYTATQKDVALSMLLGLTFASTDLPKQAIDYYYYTIQKDRMNGPLVNFIVNNYFNMSDSYTSPQVDTPVTETFELAKDNTFTVQ